MRTHIAVALCLCLLPILEAVQGPVCFSCERVDRLESCRTVTRCLEDEQCMVSSFRNSVGGVMFNFGCQKKATCDLNSFHPFGRREETPICVECCDGDLCQSSSKNCLSGSTSLHPNTKLCYTCYEISIHETCNQVEFCPHEDDLCFVHHSLGNTGDPIKSMGCRSSSSCKVWTTLMNQHTHNSGFICFHCCNHTACYSDCMSTFAPTTTHLTRPTTTIRPAALSTTITKGTVKPTGTGLPPNAKLCYVCDEIPLHGTCNNLEACANENDLCYIHHSIGNTGDPIKSMGCKTSSTCKVWTTFINQHTHSSALGCFNCCNQTACNSECKSAFEPTTSPLTRSMTTPLPTQPSTRPAVLSTTISPTGPTCFKCDDVTDPSSCSTEVTCQSDEACFTERMVDSSSQSWYIYGCQKRQVCQAIDSGSGVLGRREMRRDGVETFILACMQCCYTDRCNLRLCQQHSEDFS